MRLGWETQDGMCIKQGIKKTGSEHLVPKLLIHTRSGKHVFVIQCIPVNLIAILPEKIISITGISD